MKTIFIVVFLLSSFESFGRSYKKHDTCFYGQQVYVKDLLYKLPKGDLEPKLELVRRRAQEKCMGVSTTNRKPDNGISKCLFYSQVAKKGRHKGKRVICVNHACPGTKYEMDEPCRDFAIKPGPKRRARRRSNVKPKKFVVNRNKTYKRIEKCHYGTAGILRAPLKNLSKQELQKQGQLIRRIAQETCLSLDQLEQVPTSGVHSCLFYDQVARKGRNKGKRIICVDFSCTGSGYIMDETCQNFKIK